MLDILRDYLTGKVTAELFDVLDKSHNTFLRIGLLNTDSEFEDLLMTSDNADANDVVDSVYRMTKLYQKDILNNLGVVVTNEITMKLADSIICGLLDLQDIEKSFANNITPAMNGKPEEVLAEVLSFVCVEDELEILDVLETVSRFAIAKINEVLSSKRILDSNMLLVSRADRITQFNKFSLFFGSPLSLVKGLIQQGVSVGYPFTIYIERLGKELEKLEPKLAAMELILMAVVSSDGNENPRSIIKQHIDKYITDIEVITKIDIAVTDYLLRFINEQT
jgi:hypothetical protein